MKPAPNLEVGPACPSARRERSRRTLYSLYRLYTLDKLYTLIFYLSILTFLIGFNFADAPMQSGWYQQFMPYPAGGQIKDIFFIDSLFGFAVSDSSILKTTNGGDNWTVKLNGYYLFQRVQFLNANTGFACAGNNQLLKTTNAGENWDSTVLPDIYPFDMSVLNQDTIWLVNPGSLAGGVFRTTNGGVNWERQAAFASNPAHIYMFNARIGFIDAGSLRRTTDGGSNWTPIIGAGNFLDMFFIDSLTGWKCNLDMKKTTDGGFNWVGQVIPFGGNITWNNVYKLTRFSRDTLWGFGGNLIVGGTPPTRGILFRTANSGNNWLFQLPDTSIHIVEYFYGQFINNKVGWAYHIGQGGIHTTNGGNDTFYTQIKQITSNIPKEFRLSQNYPNPFNPNTNIKYQIARLPDGQVKSGHVKLQVFDVSGRLVKTLVNQKQDPGEYEVEFNASDLSSGIYFYRMQITVEKGGVIYVETKKAILIK